MRTLVFAAAALIPLLTSCTDDTCSVTEDPEGTVHIQCSGDSIDVEPCFAGLPDLDGSGAADAGDCGLVGAGKAQRELCSSEEAWWSLPGCRSAATSGTISSFNVSVSATVQSASGLRFVYGAQQELHVWRDANSDGRFEPAEDTTIASSAVSVIERPMDAVFIGWSTSVFGGTVVVWNDADRDGIPASSEIATHQLVGGGERLIALRSFVTLGRVAFAFQSDAAERPIRAWSDIDGDGVVDASEVIDIAPHGNGLQGAFEGNVVYSELVSGTVSVWSPGSAWASNTGAIRAATADEARCEDIVTWHGTRFCREPAIRGGFIWRLRSTEGAVLLPLAGASIGLYDDQLVVHSTATQTTRSTIWRDLDGSRFPDPGELVSVAGRAVMNTDGRLFTFGPAWSNGFAPFVETWHPLATTRYLGESCDTDANEACAGELECRISGNALEPHCVPAVE
ncbi:MAG: hypothetical protein KJZ91_14165 [Myxococcales bacterium]|nr:hypothetical protein [Myxococcales bacterium]